MSTTSVIYLLLSLEVELKINKIHHEVPETEKIFGETFSVV